MSDTSLPPNSDRTITPVEFRLSEEEADPHLDFWKMIYKGQLAYTFEVYSHVHWMFTNPNSPAEGRLKNHEQVRYDELAEKHPQIGPGALNNPFGQDSIPDVVKDWLRSVRSSGESLERWLKSGSMELRTNHVLG